VHLDALFKTSCLIMTGGGALMVGGLSHQNFDKCPTNQKKNTTPPPTLGSQQDSASVEGHFGFLHHPSTAQKSTGLTAQEPPLFVAGRGIFSLGSLFSFFLISSRSRSYLIL
jgi:hypothetical protein